MKTIKTAAGTKHIETQDATLIPIHLREIIREHRAKLINNLMGDLPTYINYKFDKKATKEELESIATRLESLKESRFAMDNYYSLLNQVMKKDFISLENGMFYSEIDSVIKSELNSLF